MKTPFAMPPDVMSSLNRRQFGRWVLAQSGGDEGDVSAPEAASPAAASARKTISEDDALGVPDHEDAARTSRGERSPVEKKKLAVSVASMLIGGILVLGFLLLAMVFLLGRRARRIATERGRPIGTPDPLWYLRRKKAVPLDERDSRGDAADHV